MSYQIITTKHANKQLHKLDNMHKNQVLDEIIKLSQLDNPRLDGKALKDNLKGLWSYRAGDFRIVGEIDDKQALVVIAHIGNRRELYKQLGKER